MATGNKQNILNWLRVIPASFIKGDTRPKVFFLLLSVFLWFLIKLSRGGYTADIRYPVNYKEIPADKKLINEPPEALTITLRGGGFELMRHKLRSLRPIEIRVAELEISDTNRYRWNTEAEREMLASQFADDVEILNIKPQEIFFDFSEIKNKRMKVHLKGDKQYSNYKAMYRQPQLEPDSITIWGTKEQLAEIDSIFTETVVLTAEEDSMSVEADLNLPDGEGMEFSHQTVRVNLLFASLTEGSVEVPLQLKNPPSEYEVTLVPARVKVTYRVPVRDFPRVEAEQFRASVDYDSAKEGDQLLSVQLDEVPGFVRKVRANPKKVEYILTER